MWAKLAIATMALWASIAAAQMTNTIPESVLKFEALIRNPEMRQLFVPENAPPDTGPIYTAPSGTDRANPIAYGGIDICAAIDYYDKSGATGYIFPTKALMGSGNFLNFYRPYDEYEVMMHFTGVETQERCVEMLEKGTLIVAYGGWCTAGVVDEKPHFSSPNKAPYMVKRYGEKTVVYFTNMANTDVPFDPEHEKIASKFLDALTPASTLDIRGRYVPVMLDDYTGYQPPKEGVDWVWER